MIEEELFDLDNLLLRNNIDKKKFELASYKSLLISIFELMVEEMENNDKKLKIRKRIMNSKNKCLTIQNLVYELTGCKLSEIESELILNYVCAYFNKKNSRKTFDSSFKQKFISNQKNKCLICGSHIELCDSELDHIIPWVYVGDELGNTNYQILCKSCNRRKNKNSAYNLKLFLVNR